MLTFAIVLLLAGALLMAAGGAVVAAGLTVAVVTFALTWVLLVKSLATRRLAVRTGTQALSGRRATVRVPPRPVGQVVLDGALWRARMWEPDAELSPSPVGSTVVVDSIDGLTLIVRPAEEWELH